MDGCCQWSPYTRSGVGGPGLPDRNSGGDGRAAVGHPPVGAACGLQAPHGAGLPAGGVPRPGGRRRCQGRASLQRGGSQRAGSPGPGDGGTVRAEPPYKGRSPRTLEARLAGAAGQEMFVLGELVMLEPDPKLLDPALPSASSLPGALDWADHQGRESQVERGRFPCHRPPHPSLGLPPRLTEPCPAGDGHPRESSPFISHGEADTESVYEGKNMALFEVNLTSSSEREVAGEAVLHTRGPTLASR